MESSRMPPIMDAHGAKSRAPCARQARRGASKRRRPATSPSKGPDGHHMLGMGARTAVPLHGGGLPWWELPGSRRPDRRQRVPRRAPQRSTGTPAPGSPFTSIEDNTTGARCPHRPRAGGHVDARNGSVSPQRRSPSRPLAQPRIASGRRHRERSFSCASPAPSSPAVALSYRSCGTLKLRGRSSRASISRGSSTSLLPRLSCAISKWDNDRLHAGEQLLPAEARELVAAAGAGYHPCRREGARVMVPSARARSLAEAMPGSMLVRAPWLAARRGESVAPLRLPQGARGSPISRAQAPATADAGVAYQNGGTKERPRSAPRAGRPKDSPHGPSRTPQC